MKRVFGGLLMGLGILIATLSGMCTLIFGGGTLFDSYGVGVDTQMLMLVLIYGGVPFMIGVGLFFAGRALLRDGEAQDYSPEASQPAAPIDPDTMAHPDPDRDPPPSP